MCPRLSVLVTAKVSSQWRNGSLQDGTTASTILFPMDFIRALSCDRHPPLRKFSVGHFEPCSGPLPPSLGRFNIFVDDDPCHPPARPTGLHKRVDSDDLPDGIPIKNRTRLECTPRVRQGKSRTVSPLLCRISNVGATRMFQFVFLGSKIVERRM